MSTMYDEPQNQSVLCSASGLSRDRKTSVTVEPVCAAGVRVI